MQGDYHLLRSEKSARDWLDYLIVNWDWKKPIAVKSELNIGTRTLAQNAAIRVFDKLLAQACNEAGCTQKVYFQKRKEGANVLWTPNQVHENIFNPMVQAVTGKESSSRLYRNEVSDVHHHIDMWFAEHLPEVQVPPFPNKEAFKELLV